MQFVRPANEIIKASFYSPPWGQCLDPGSHPDTNCNRCERINRHELVSSNMEYAFYNRNLEDLAKGKEQQAEYEVYRGNGISAERLDRF